ncbi:MAG: nucleotidyltransferase domain-containing protein [Pseudomonadales bacterium]|nr:nucleotidyltransferase domain-containing protein [Pseudomonadales bacterium]
MDYVALAMRFVEPGTRAVALMGSHARGTYGPYSDIDIVRFVDDEERAPFTRLIDGQFVVVSDVSPQSVERWFTEPEAVTAYLEGVRTLVPLYDRDNYLSTIVERAQVFEWTQDMQVAADRAALDMMIGTIEEVQKTLEGLRTGDIGRMLNGKHGLTWLMLAVVRVKHGLLIGGDNGVVNDVIKAMAPDSEWSRLCLDAFGVDGASTIKDELRAGLSLYLLTLEMFAAEGEERTMLDEIAARIQRELARD